MKILLPFALLLCCGLSQAQSNDFILLKKKGKTVRRLFAGQYILADVDSTGPYELLIKDVFQDSVRLMGYTLVQSATGYGGFYIDTADRYYLKRHYTSLTAFYNDRNKKFNLTSSGGTLMAAGFLGLLITGVNAAYLKQQLFSGGTPWFALGSLGVGGVGYLLYKASIKPIVIGKKYQLVYIRVNS